jgi:hypothetical protein
MENRSSPVSKLITVRLTEEEYNFLKMFVDETGTSFSWMMRKLLKKEIDRYEQVRQTFMQ